jgi:hypothetical protein
LTTQLFTEKYAWDFTDRSPTAATKGRLALCGFFSKKARRHCLFSTKITSLFT